MFARRLNANCAIDVKEAQSGDLLIAGRALICPGDRHIKVRRLPLASMVVLSDEERLNGHRPSVDILFRSVAADFGPRVIGVLMTGMGDDGAAGMGQIKEPAVLPWRKPKIHVLYSACRRRPLKGFAMRVVPLDMLANTLVHP